MKNELINFIYIYISPNKYIAKEYFKNVSNYNNLFKFNLINLFNRKKLPIEYLYSIKQTRFYHPINNIILCCNKNKLTTNDIKELNNNNVIIIDIDELNNFNIIKTVEIFTKNTCYENYSKNESGNFLFMLTTYLRFIICLECGKKLKYNKLMYIEGDNLLYYNIDNFINEQNLNIFKTIYFPDLIIPKDKVASSAIFISSIQQLEYFNFEILNNIDIYKNHFICDMSVPVIIRERSKNKLLNIKFLNQSILSDEDYIVDGSLYGQFLSKLMYQDNITFEQLSERYIKANKILYINEIYPNLDQIIFEKKSKSFNLLFNKKIKKFINLHIHYKPAIKFFTTY